MRNLVNLNAGSGKSEKSFIGYFCRKYLMFELKKYRGAVSRKMAYGFKHDINYLANFQAGSCNVG